MFTATVNVGDFSISLSKMGRSSKQRINKDVVTLNNTLDQMDLTDNILNLSPQRSKRYILFKCTRNIFKDRPHGRSQNKPQQTQEN